MSKEKQDHIVDVNKKVTAVEWYENEINRRGPKEDNPPKWLQELYNVAKKMEKEQIVNAWMATDNELQRLAAEQYYNETFNAKPK